MLPIINKWTLEQSTLTPSKQKTLERRDKWNKDSCNVFRSVVNIVQPALGAFVLRFESGALCFAHEWFGIHSLSTANISTVASVELQRWAITLLLPIESYLRASYTMIALGMKDPDKESESETNVGEDSVGHFLVGISINYILNR